MNYGIRFKKYRERTGLTQNEAAKLIGVKGYQLANYETGRSEPSIDVLRAMSRVYNISIDLLVGNVKTNVSIPIDEEEYDIELALQKLKKFVEENNKK